MEPNDNSNDKDLIPNEEISFRCTYLIKDNNEIQIINDRGIVEINEEIESKIKILNGNKKEDLIFKKQFNSTGLNTVDFIIEGKLTNMSYMFNSCSSLKKVEFISVDTSQVTNLKAMFQLCDELEYIDLSNFETSNVTNMMCVFSYCPKLRRIIGYNNFNTIKVNNMYGMFNGCWELEDLDVSNYNTANVTDMSWMFGKCRKLKEIKGINNLNNVPRM